MCAEGCGAIRSAMRHTRARRAVHVTLFAHSNRIACTDRRAARAAQGVNGSGDAHDGDDDATAEAVRSRRRAGGTRTFGTTAHRQNGQNERITMSLKNEKKFIKLLLLVL